MAVGTTSNRDTLSVSEIDGILTATAKKRLLNRKGKVTALDRDNTPGLNWFRKQPKTKEKAIQGGYTAQVKTESGQEFQAWSGQDTLNYADFDTIFELDFGVGNVHIGRKLVHQQLEEAGIDVDYRSSSTGKSRPMSELGGAWQVVHNLAAEKMDDAQNDFLQNLSRTLYRDNAANTKLWGGWDALFPRSGNSTGLVGGKSRSNPALRHQLATAVAAADLETTLDNLVRDADRRNSDGSGIKALFFGKDVLNVFKALQGGSSAITPISALQRNTDVASDLARIGVGIPDDAFYHRASKTALVYEPTFERLDELDAPAVLWKKSIIGVNPMHTWFKADPGKDMLEVIKPTPYNQQITYISTYGEYALTTDKPNANLNLVIA